MLNTARLAEKWSYGKFDSPCAKQDSSSKEETMCVMISVGFVLLLSSRCKLPFFSSQIRHLFSGPLESCYSGLLFDNGKGLRAMLLTLIGLKVSCVRKIL